MPGGGGPAAGPAVQLRGGAGLRRRAPGRGGRVGLRQRAPWLVRARQSRGAPPVPLRRRGVRCQPGCVRRDPGLPRLDEAAHGGPRPRRQAAAAGVARGPSLPSGRQNGRSRGHGGLVGGGCLARAAVALHAVHPHGARLAPAPPPRLRHQRRQRGQRQRRPTRRARRARRAASARCTAFGGGAGEQRGGPSLRRRGGEEALVQVRGWAAASTAPRAMRGKEYKKYGGWVWGVATAEDLLCV
mmetsp:Transcript_38284/g.91754  ORF Transcript_38284/g.91754 Transcript_38284/m.91754 type:complete len:242 (+) Transcript_38284:81-806(+)